MSTPKVDVLPARYAAKKEEPKKKKSVTSVIAKAVVSRVGEEGVSRVKQAVRGVINKKGGDAAEKVVRGVVPGAKVLRGKELAEAQAKTKKIAGVDVSAGARSTGVDIGAAIAKEFAGGDVNASDLRKLATAIEKLDNLVDGYLPERYYGVLIRKLAEGEGAEERVKFLNDSLNFVLDAFPPVALPGVPVPVKLSWMKHALDIAFKLAISYAPEQWGEDRTLKRKEYEDAIRAEAQRLEDEIKKTTEQIKAEEARKATVSPTKIIPNAKPAPAANNKRTRKKKAA
jgi:hypothetical protein